MKNQKGLKFELIPTEYKQYNSIIVELLRDIEISEIPSKYIDSIEVGYSNGMTITLSGAEVKQPIPVIRGGNKKPVDDRFKEVTSVRVFIDLDSMENDINSRIDKMFDGKIRT